MKYQFTLVCFLLGMMIGVILFFGFETTELNGEKVDCYDRYGNKIEGQTCIVENGFDSLLESQLASLPIIFILVAFLTFFGLINDMFSNNRIGVLQ